MTDIKVTPENKIKVAFVGAGGISDINAPTTTELNAGTDISRAIAFDGFEAAASESSDIDDAAITDTGNAVEAGFDQFAVTLPLFHPTDFTDTSDIYQIAYELFNAADVSGYIVVRFTPDAAYSTAWAEGDFVSVYKVILDYVEHDTEGEDSVKYIVHFLPQGEMKENAIVAYASTDVVVLPATLSSSAGDKDVATATLGGVSITQGATWTSSNTAVATVSENGVITSVASGSATITADHPAAANPDTCAVTVS